MNYMEQVAEMLGVELEEEFNITGYDAKYRFTEHGLEYFNDILREWVISDCLNDILNGSQEIVKIPILDAKEKEYLSNIIKPFRDCVECIFKYSSPYYAYYEYIAIEYYEKLTEEKCKMFFPCFEKDAMYKGMQLYKKYKLEELGL